MHVRWCVENARSLHRTHPLLSVFQETDHHHRRCDRHHSYCDRCRGHRPRCEKQVALHVRFLHLFYRVGNPLHEPLRSNDSLLLIREENCMYRYLRTRFFVVLRRSVFVLFACDHALYFIDTLNHLINIHLFFPSHHCRLVVAR